MFDLAHPPPDGGQLDRAHHAAEVCVGLEDADDPPLERAEHLPPVQRGPVDHLARRGLVGADELVDRPEPADPGLGPEAPGAHAQPAEVLERIAEVGQLPVEDGAQPVGPDDEVAVAEVAVDDRVAGAGRGRPVPVEPPEPQLERGVRLAGGVERRRGAGRPGRRRAGRARTPRGCGGCRRAPRRTGPARTGRAAANSSSRRILRAMVSPSTRSTTIQAGPSASGSSPAVATTPGTGTPSAPAARSSAASVRMPAVRALPLRSRWRMSGRPLASNAQVSRDAPPDRRRSPVTSPGSTPTTPASATASSAARSSTPLTRSAPGGDRRRRAGGGTR